MRFVITLDGDLGASGCTLYNELKYAEISVLQAETECYIYGEANNYVLSDILNKCWKYANRTLKLNISKSPD